MAQISDNDAIFNQLDQLNNEGKYEQILETIATVPEDKVSNKWLFKAHSDEETEVIAVHTVNVNGKAFTLTEVAPPKQ